MKWGVRRERKRQMGDSSKTHPIQKTTKSKASNMVRKGFEVYSTMMTASLIDDIFYGGSGKRMIINAGRFFTTSWLKKHGHTNIKWF